MKTNLANKLKLLTLLICFLLAGSGFSQQKPNILVIWGDDIGWENLSSYSMGTMGYTTPNIDKIGLEGIRFTDHYAQPSCTAGRAAFITGQYPIRSGMTTVGQPGDALGLQAASPSLAALLKSNGYATGHFGKNHLGDRNEHLPTVHGFDEFFGNLYHLNTQEESEQRDYQAFGKAYSGNLEDYEKQFGTRGVIHSFATDKMDSTEDPRFGVVGKQIIEDTGPLTQERMKNFDEGEVIPKALDFMKKSKNQLIDGVNNLDYWKGVSDHSERTSIFYYYESKLTAVRMGPWKFHFSTKEDYYANVIPRTVPLVFNIRMDPFESFESTDAYGHLMQKVSWLLQPMGKLMEAHLKTLAEYPPVQGGKSFDMSNVVDQFLKSSMQ